MLSPGEDAGHPESGTLVAPGVNAQHHQHMFAVRIDPAIDDAEGGVGVVVSEARAARCACSCGVGCLQQRETLSDTPSLQKLRRRWMWWRCRPARTTPTATARSPWNPI